MAGNGLLNYQGQALQHVPYTIAQSEKKQLFNGDNMTEYELVENSPSVKQKPADE